MKEEENPATQPAATKPGRTPFRKLHLLIYIPVFLFMVCPLTLVFIGFSEGKKAERDWENFRTHWEARGEIFELDSLIPPDQPAAENFAASPIIAELFHKSDSPRLLELNLQTISDLNKPSHSAPDSIRALNAPATPLSVFIQEAGSHDKESHSNNRESARAILAILKPLTPLLEELEIASRLPKAKFPLEYEKTLAMEFRHLRPLSQAADILVLRSRALLASGDSQAATRDLLTLIQIARLTGSEPSLLSHLIEVNIYKTALSVIWQGLGDKSFHAEDLQRLDEALKNHEINPRVMTALRTERAFFIQFISNITHRSQRQRDRSSDIEKTARALKYTGFSKAFWLRNKLNYSSFLQDHALSSGDEINRDAFPITRIQNFDRDAADMRHHAFLRSNPYTMMALMAMPACGSTMKNSLQTSVRIDLCRTAIALKQFLNENGNYPDTLSPLAPEYIDALPPDTITGEPFKYRIKPDGTPMIYSVGLNSTDEGGLLKKNRSHGDWVWMYTLPADFDGTEWRN